jgi:hypothetical protein
MTLKASKDVGFLLIGGRNVLSAPLTEINEEHEHLMEQVDGIQGTTDVWAPVGQRTFTLTQEGFYNNTVGSLHEALETADAQPLLYGPEGNAVGDELVALSAVRTTYDRLPARGAFHKARAVYRAAETHAPHGRGKILTPYGAYTTLGPTNQAIVDNLLATSGGAHLFLGVSALNLDGGTGLTVEIRHSTDNFGANDALLYTAFVATTAPSAQRAVVAGTVNRYVRARHTFTGASGAARSATFAVGIQRT